MAYPAKILNTSAAQEQLVTGPGLLVSAQAQDNTYFVHDGTSTSTGIYLGLARFHAGDSDSHFEFEHPVQFKTGLLVTAAVAGSTCSIGVI